MTDNAPSNGTQSMLQREMAESVVRAQKTINRYTHQKAKLALYDREPNGSMELFDKLTDVHIAVLNAFQLMRQYLKEDIGDIWNEVVVGQYNGAPVLLGARPPAKVQNGSIISNGDIPDGVLFLDDFHNAVERYTVEERERFDHREKEYQHVQPKLLSLNAYQEIVDQLMYALKDAKFAPQAGVKDIREEEPLIVADGHETKEENQGPVDV